MINPPLFDEQGFLTRGVAYVRGDRHMRVGHPARLNALNALFLASDQQTSLPLDDPSWQTTAFHRPSELFMWEIGNDVQRVLFLGRLPTIFLGMLLLALAGRWAWEMSRRRWLGLLALALLAFDPSILAHMRLATTDFGLTAGALLAGYMLWRFWQRPSWLRAIIAGAAFGLLQNTKFTAGLFVPIFALAILGYCVWRVVRCVRREAGCRWQDALRPLWMLIAAYPLAAFVTLWACYGFEIGTLPPNLPTFSQLSGVTVPLAHYLEQLLDIGGRMQRTPAFLLGRYSDSGWWYYFPVAFALKTPLPTLLLLATAVPSIYLRLLLRDWRGMRFPSPFVAHAFLSLLLPGLGYFAIALTTDINLGYRHILPVLPFLVVFIRPLPLPKYR
ncbi:MAG: glycosyltransferase family 39 protein [Chloroflexota bacterium]